MGVAVFCGAHQGANKAGEAVEKQNNNQIGFFHSPFIEQLFVVAVDNPGIVAVEKFLNSLFLFLQIPFLPVWKKMHIVQVKHVGVEIASEISREGGFSRSAVSYNGDFHTYLLKDFVVFGEVNPSFPYVFIILCVE